MFVRQDHCARLVDVESVGPSGERQRFDAVELRRLLDALRSGLSSQGSVIPDVFTSTGGHEPLVGAIRQVLSALASHNIPAQRVMSEVASVVRSADQTAVMLKLLTNACTLWSERTVAILGGRKIDTLNRLLGQPVPDVLGLLDLTDDENRHTAVLRWLLDPRSAPTIAPATLLALAGRLKNTAGWTTELNLALKSDTLSVRREYTIADEWTDEDRLERIDLVVSGPRFILAIENKLWALEHGEQTQRYWDWLDGLPEHILRAGIFLSPSGMPPASQSFRAMSYLELLSCLLEAPSRGEVTAEEEILMASYTRTLANGVLSAELRAVQRGGVSR
jgi:hypothetical protein